MLGLCQSAMGLGEDHAAGERLGLEGSRSPSGAGPCLGLQLLAVPGEGSVHGHRGCGRAAG